MYIQYINNQSLLIVCLCWFVHHISITSTVLVIMYQYTQLFTLEGR